MPGNMFNYILKVLPSPYFLRGGGGGRVKKSKGRR
jgi:hypothetical protein